MKRDLICIICPKGCNLNVEIDDSSAISVSGNTCKKGMEYAINECTNPVRCVTTTMKTSSGEPISVKTDKAIPKDNMFELMQILNNEIITLPICIGDVIIKDIFGCNIVATQNKY